MLLAIQDLREDRIALARREAAASTARLPITEEMAWTVPQLLKRVQLLSPGVRSTTGALRALISQPHRDREFAKAFTDSGFMTCDEAIGRVHWRFDLGDMTAKYRSASGAHVMEHCRALLLRERGEQAFDWDAVLADLATLGEWFPELRTVRQLEQLYTRLHSLHIRSVHAARRFLEAGAAAEHGTLRRE